MTRLLATTALVGALLAAPALAQTMNSAPAAGTGTAIQPPASANDAKQTGESRAMTPGVAKPGAPRKAPTGSSGSSVRTTDKSGDNSADQLNREELSQLHGQQQQ